MATPDPDKTAPKKDKEDLAQAEDLTDANQEAMTDDGCPILPVEW